MSEQREEKPTQRRLEKAREDGQFPVAREFVSGAQFLGLVFMVHSWAGDWFTHTAASFQNLLAAAFQGQLTVNKWTLLFRNSAWDFFVPLAVLGGCLIAIAMVAQLSSTGFGISLNKLMPDLKRFNPMSRLKEMPHQNLTSLGQASCFADDYDLGGVCDRPGSSGFISAYTLYECPGRNGQDRGCLVGLVVEDGNDPCGIRGVDFFRQRQRFTRQLRMSKQEIKDESRDSEGNPLIKARVRRLQRERRRRQMMSDVATATAVITNPTHYAVAIRYEPETMASPKVVAKGRNYLARRIRERAIENQVPIVENPPLARGLYSAVEVGQEIPATFYRAIAEVLAYIYKLMGSRRSS
ncbi:MAG: EscU/YscU/HrcU family type III secretion system export apparatus switch protein [Bryobacteraceae bacterium]